jgi:hypothetical protein
MVIGPGLRRRQNDAVAQVQHTTATRFAKARQAWH